MQSRGLDQLQGLRPRATATRSRLAKSASAPQVAGRAGDLPGRGARCVCGILSQLVSSELAEDDWTLRSRARSPTVFRVVPTSSRDTCFGADGCLVQITHRCIFEGNCVVRLRKRWARFVMRIGSPNGRAAAEPERACVLGAGTCCFRIAVRLPVERTAARGLEEPEDSLRWRRPSFASVIPSDISVVAFRDGRMLGRTSTKYVQDRAGYAHHRTRRFGCCPAHRTVSHLLDEILFHESTYTSTYIAFLPSESEAGLAGSGDSNALDAPKI